MSVITTFSPTSPKGEGHKARHEEEDDDHDADGERYYRPFVDLVTVQLLLRTVCYRLCGREREV